MIARRRRVHPIGHVAAPSWTHLFRRAETSRPYRRNGMPDAERSAMRGARYHRASTIRVDAERHWSGLPDR
jgi:hypothetical protein